MGLVFLQFFLLTPAPLEQASRSEHFVNNTFLQHLFGIEGKNRFGVETSKHPDYTIHGFHYVSSRGGVKQWRILSKVAHLYHDINFVHSRDVQAFLFNPDGVPTVITGDESGYQMTSHKLTVIGNVVTRFPDGFTVRSDEMHYNADTRDLEVPTNIAVSGEGLSPDQNRRIEFESKGLQYAMAKSEIILSSEVRVVSHGENDSLSVIRSDRARIDRTKQIAYFTMNPSRPAPERFARLHQPDLFVKGREMEFRYASGNPTLRQIIATRDVYIEELEVPPAEPVKAVTPVSVSMEASEEEDWVPDDDDDLAMFRFATCGRADYNAETNFIYLTVFPQIYQDNDTVTGERIAIDRTRNIVEVERSNAYSPGD